MVNEFYRQNGEANYSLYHAKLTEPDTEIPLKHDRIDELYKNKRERYYIMINTRYNKAGYRNSRKQLYKKLLAVSDKQPRILSMA